MPPPRAILVDAFGTIVDADPPWSTERGRCLEACALDAPRGPFLDRYEVERRADHARAPEDWREFDFPDRFARTFRALGYADAADRGRRAAATYFAWQGRLVAPLPDAKEGLERLRALAPLVLVSNYPDGPTLVSALRRIGLAGFFVAHVVSAEVGYLKPHRAVFEAALRHAGAAAEEVVMIGNDAHDDVGGAVAAGIRAILVAYPRGSVHGVPEGASGFAGDLVEAAARVEALARA